VLFFYAPTAFGAEPPKLLRISPEGAANGLNEFGF
jgi:hypothetical protein